ncbi:uncharacterized protein LOC120331091 isoform X2 [Styela clava]
MAGQVSVILFRTSSAVISTRNLCQNESGIVRFKEPYDVSDILSTWILEQRNCSGQLGIARNTAVVLYIERIQLQAFEAAAGVLNIQNHCINEMAIGTCYVFQQKYSLCKNVVNKHQERCKKFTWVYGEKETIEIHLRRVLVDPILIDLNYTVVACDSDPGITRKETSVQPIGTIILGVLLAIVILLLLIMIIRQYKQTAIQAVAKKKSEFQGFETFDGEYDEDPYQHYQVPSNRPLGGYEPTLKPVEESIYQVPSNIPLDQGLPANATEDTVIYAKPMREVPEGYGSVE